MNLITRICSKFNALSDALIRFFCSIGFCTEKLEKSIKGMQNWRKFKNGGFLALPPKMWGSDGDFPSF